MALFFHILGIITPTFIFFRGVETTNQTTVPSRCFPTSGSNHLIDSLICGWIAWQKKKQSLLRVLIFFPLVLWAGKSFWNPGSPVNPHACHAQPFLPMGMSNEKTKVVMVYYWAYLMISPWYPHDIDYIWMIYILILWMVSKNPAPPWMLKTPLNNWINHLMYHLVKDFAGPSTVCIGLKFPVESHGLSRGALALQVFAWLRDHMGVTCELFASPLWGLPKGRSIHPMSHSLNAP